MDSLTALKTAIQNGSEAYDEIQSVNAMLNRKLQRQTPSQVLDYLDKITCAIVEGGNQNLIGANTATDCQNLPKTIFHTLQTAFKTWQNAALPTFISGCCLTGDNQQQLEQAKVLPETLQRNLDVMAQLTAKDNKSPKLGDLPVLCASVASHYARFVFASKIVAESATKSLSDENLRRARYYAQISAVESYLFIAGALPKIKKASQQAPSVVPFVASLFSVLPENFVDQDYSASKSMILSSTMWLGDILSKTKNIENTLSNPNSFDVTALFLQCSKTALNILGKTFVSASTPIDSKLFEELPPALQARCLVQLAWRGLSRASPVSVLLRRLTSMGLSSSKPCFLFLNCVGLLSDAPASQKRDQALKELVDVYFTRKPAPPLASQTDLKKDFDAFVSECMAWKGGNSNNSAVKAEMD